MTQHVRIKSVSRRTVCMAIGWSNTVRIGEKVLVTVHLHTVIADQKLHTFFAHCTATGPARQRERAGSHAQTARPLTRPAVPACVPRSRRHERKERFPRLPSVSLASTRRLGAEPRTRIEEWPLYAGPRRASRSCSLPSPAACTCHNSHS